MGLCATLLLSCHLDIAPSGNLRLFRKRSGRPVAVRSTLGLAPEDCAG